MSTVIKVENVSKQYRLGKVGTGTISHDLNRWWHNLRGKEDPYLKIGETNDRTQKGSTDYVWALQDINFEIEQGSAVGIIGRNGAGKSTLLKILSRTTAPTTGDVKLKGRVASLLEVGTGFHPELSGRENIYLNGAILGMTRREITRKFDEIVAFAGVERYIDTPVKRYSSGMYVRLAFAVAAHLESEILIIDEVLAVGDAEFQKKCLGKMNDVSKGEGRTVLFVSHNMGSIRALCKKGIYLLNGSVGFIGSINATIDKYTNQPTLLGSLNNEKDKIQIKSVSIANQLRETKALEFGDTLIITLNCYVDGKVDKSYIWVGVDSKYGSLFGANTLIDGHSLPPISGSFSITLKFPELYLLPQEYIISCGAREADGHTLLMTTSEIGFFSIVSSVQELGLNGPLAEQLAPNSAPLLWSYEMFINGNIFASFNPKDLK